MEARLSAVWLVFFWSVNAVQTNTDTIAPDDAVAVLDSLCSGFSGQ